MFGRILVPLDGSEMAERALEPAFSIARLFASEVILLRVALLDEASLAATAALLSFTEIARSSQNFEVEAAEAYLTRLGEARAGQASAIHKQVVRGTPAQVIVEAAGQAKVDLIVMSTHGRSGLSRLIYGSIAEAVLRGSQVPVLLVPNRHPKSTNGA